ncbi:MAG TPA: hypothetical protein VIK86_01785 [Candidatus Paceibacterota bacterium]
MKTTALITLYGFIFLFTSCRFIPEDKLDFVNSCQDVTDSLYVLRNLKDFNTTDADITYNCFIGYHKEFIINNVNLGDFDELVQGIKPNEDSLKKVYSGDFKRLFLLMAYLRKNHISGYYIDEDSHRYVFLYREYEYGDRSSDSRSILFKDEYSDIFKNEYFIKDESDKLILVIHNMHGL